MTEQHFTLDPYAARSCELKTFNAFVPGLVAPERRVPLPPFFHDPDAVETDVFAGLRAGVESYVDLRALRRTPSADQEAAALRALDEGYELIIAPLLPRDFAGHRAGRPSALLRRGDGYVPIVVKYHRVLESASPEITLLYSTLEEPYRPRSDPGRIFRWGSRLTAALQAAHLWRLLEATGRAASEPVVGLIGTERIAPSDAETRRQHLVITWLNLAEPLAAPDPATVDVPDAAEPISALTRYDHEHARRVDLARAALAGDQGPTPVVHRECPYCAWVDICAERLPDDDLSRRISKAPLDAHEVRVLRGLGVSSVADLADADLELMLPEYLPRVSHRDGGEDRVRLAQRRARLIVSGAELERTSSGAVEVPEHELEIDLDMETSASERVYLWGFLVDDRATGRREYRAFVRWEQLDAAGERDLAQEALEWLRAITTGRDAAIYHYSDYETLQIARLGSAIAEKSDASLAAWASKTVSQAFVDMFTLVKGHFFGANGLGLKVVASSGAGFHWRDEQPGGLASQGWFDNAVDAEAETDREAARTRVLEYNEDDVLATWNLRRWLRTLT